MTFDEAQDKFRENPSLKTAKEYARTASEYYLDDMILDETFCGAVCELQEKGYPTILCLSSKTVT